MYTRTLDLSGKPTDAMIVRDADGAFIPADPANHDRLAYQQWLEAGNTPADPAPAARPA